MSQKCMFFSFTVSIFCLNLLFVTLNFSILIPHLLLKLIRLKFSRIPFTTPVRQRQNMHAFEMLGLPPPTPTSSAPCWQSRSHHHQHRQAPQGDARPPFATLISVIVDARKIANESPSTSSNGIFPFQNYCNMRWICDLGCDLWLGVLDLGFLTCAGCVLHLISWMILVFIKWTCLEKKPTFCNNF